MKRSEAITNLVGLVVLAVLAYAFWGVFKGPVIFVLTLGILIAIHEWGHFIAARCVRVRVFEFALGFGPKVTTYMRRKGTEYTVRLIPAGGFVNLKGMMPDEPVTADGVNGQRPAERAIVYLAGPLMNILLAAVVFTCTPWLVGSSNENQVLVGSVVRKQAADQMTLVSRNGIPVFNDTKSRGLRPGDEVLQVNGHAVRKIEDLTRPIYSSTGKEVRVTVRRKGEELVYSGVPRAGKQDNFRVLVVDAVPTGTSLQLLPGDQLDYLDGKMISGAADPVAKAQRILQEKPGKNVTAIVWRPGAGSVELTGAAVPLKLHEVATIEREVGLLQLVPVFGLGPRLPFTESAEIGFRNLTANMFALFAMFGKPKELQNNVGGVISIWSMINDVGSLPPIYWCSLLGSLSVSLAVFNLFPIPVLDGGHLLMLAWEVFRRKRLDAETYKRVYLVGIAIVGTLALAITWKDIVKHFL